MSKKIAAAKDPETEVTREDILKLSGAALSKLAFVTSRDKWGFPKPVRSGPKGKLLYSLKAVTEWLEKNNLKTIVITAEDRAPLDMFNKAEKAALSSAEIATLSIGIKPHPFKGHGKSIRVHVAEQHGYEKPHPQLGKFSNSGAAHRSHYLSVLE